MLAYVLTLSRNRYFIEDALIGTRRDPLPPRRHHRGSWWAKRKRLKTLGHPIRRGVRALSGSLRSLIDSGPANEVDAIHQREPTPIGQFTAARMGEKTLSTQRRVTPVAGKGRHVDVIPFQDVLKSKGTI